MKSRHLRSLSLGSMSWFLSLASYVGQYLTHSPHLVHASNSINCAAVKLTVFIEGFSFAMLLASMIHEDGQWRCYHMEILAEGQICNTEKQCEDFVEHYCDVIKESRMI